MKGKRKRPKKASASQRVSCFMEWQQHQVRIGNIVIKPERNESAKI
jgi:hypothetical protein